MSLPSTIFFFQAYDENGQVVYSGPLEDWSIRDTIEASVQFYADGHPYVYSLVVREFNDEGFEDHRIPVNRSQDRLDSWYERNGREKRS